MPYKTVDLYEKPREVVMSKIKPETESDKPEMSVFESAFLCGLIREKRPRNILEIGVAAGGTTAIIMECLKLIKLNIPVSSIDYSEVFYRDIDAHKSKKRKSGFLLDYMDDVDKSDHKFYFGGGIARFIDKIGKNIDFVVLDTMHVLPGELLDFVTLLPFLSKNATIVLHDISYHVFGRREGYATGVLFNTVTANKIYQYDEARENHLSNIGAFTINDDTFKYIDDCFNALALPWQYCISDRDYDEYLSVIKENYSPDITKMFETFMKAAKNSYDSRALKGWKRVRRLGRVLLRGY